MRPTTFIVSAKTILSAFLLIMLFFVVCCKKDTAKTPPVINSGNTGNTGSTGDNGGAGGIVDNGPPGTYTASPAITLSGKHDITISGIATPSITLSNCSNIIIKNCKIGPNKYTGISTSHCTNIKVDSCYISNVSTGVYAEDSQTIAVTNSQGLNMQGPYPKGAFVQFNNVSGGGSQVSFNKILNVLGQSYPEDIISMYKSSGLANDPILIKGNKIRGGGPSKSGGGIMLGDNGGSNIVAQDNILVDPGQYGMGVAGGSNISIINNTIYGKAQSFTNVGLYYWNQSGQASSNITISGNQVNFTSLVYGVNNTFLGAGNTMPTGWSTNILNTNIGESLLPDNLVDPQ